MQIIGPDQYEDTKQRMEKQKEKKELTVADTKEVTENNFRLMLEKMENPVDVQKELAVKIKKFLDRQIEKEMENDNVLSEFTRRWIKDFNDILDKIQKNLYGEKSLHLHSVKITHADIAAKIRGRRDEENVESKA